LQREGFLVVTAPGVYHQGWNGGWSVAEAINYGDGARAKRVSDYIHCGPECPREADEQLRIEWREKPAAPDLLLVIPSWSAPKQAQTLKLGP
jgi:hypothetical protein